MAYELVDAFQIDNGELEGLGKKECFALGFEYAEMRRRLELREPGEYLFHSDNYKRVRDLCGKYSPDNWEILNHDDWPTLVIS